MNYNNLTLVGRLTKQGETRFLPDGKEVYANSIAVSKKYKTKQGETKEETMFMDFSCFSGLATTCKSYLNKGSLVLLNGEIRLENWTAQDGSNRSKHSLRVDTMKMLDGKQTDRGQQGEDTRAYQEPEITYNGVPEIDIDDGSIPF